MNQQPNQYMELKKEISTKDINFPKLYKNEKPLALLFEKINDKKYLSFLDLILKS